MTNLCAVCANELGTGLFCPSCGAERTHDGTEEAPPVDPFLGRVIQDRYEILSLINVGGMGRVYKARHRTLDRVVAIKFIHSHLLTAEVVVKRFMVEAQTASQLNHPNVISIFDFGRTDPSEGGDLFIVMEFLSGQDLATVLYAERAMPLARVADILSQTLAALGEAHQLGITHRDVKPENIILDEKRGGGDRVKVIDFGIAKLGAGPKLTTAGEIIGTPAYMAPEQVKGKDIGPGADLFAVGVILYEMLTGQLPFDGATPTEILLKTLSAPRPDPRQIAPDRGITAELAAVCVRAMDVDPKNRFESAEAFVEALAKSVANAARALATSETSPPSQDRERRGSDPSSDRRNVPTEASVPPVPFSLSATEPPMPGPTDVPGPAAHVPAPTPAAIEAPKPPLVISVPPRAPSRRPRRPESRALVGRDAEIAWARPLMAGSEAVVALWGNAGSGKSRLLRELAEIAAEAGARVLHVAGFGPPPAEVSSSALQSIIRALLAGLGDGITNEAPPVEQQGLRAIFLGEAPRAGGPTPARRGISAALAWAVRAAIAATKERIVLCIDDVDRIDGVSRAAIEDLLVEEGLERFLLVVTCKVVPESWFRGALHERRVPGLSKTDAATLLAGPHAPNVPEQDEIAPLYLEQLIRWRTEELVDQPPPQHIEALVEWRMRNLPPSHRRALQALAVTGGGTTAFLSAVVPRGDDIKACFDRLVAAGFVELGQDGARLAHAVFADVAMAIGSAKIADLHARAADALVEQNGVVERRAHHAIRARADMEAFLLVEQASRARAAQGDEDGAIAMLEDGLRASRNGALSGDPEAISGCLIFGQKVGSALSHAGRLTEANGVLGEVLELCGPSAPERGVLLEQLAQIADQRNRPSEADARRREALAIAQRAEERRPPRDTSSSRYGLVRKGNGGTGS